MAVEVREENRSFRESRASLAMRNAVAQIARNRWKANGIKQAQSCWALSEGEARNLFYGNCSANTFDKIISHKRNGGWPLYLEIGALMLGQSVDQFATSELERLNDEHARAVADRRKLIEVVSGRPAAGDLGPDSAVGVGGKSRGELGDGAHQDPDGAVK